MSAICAARQQRSSATTKPGRGHGARSVTLPNRSNSLFAILPQRHDADRTGAKDEQGGLRTNKILDKNTYHKSNSYQPIPNRKTALAAHLGVAHRQGQDRVHTLLTKFFQITLIVSLSLHITGNPVNNFVNNSVERS
ncbi:MAG: hypothetical protein O2967_18635 [Proteobacteria bacterium]|nr:hypothetical protein [Pseudomonadota bacterium]